MISVLSERTFTRDAYKKRKISCAFSLDFVEFILTVDDFAHLLENTVNSKQIHAGSFIY